MAEIGMLGLVIVGMLVAIIIFIMGTVFGALIIQRDYDKKKGQYRG